MDRRGSPRMLALAALVMAAACGPTPEPTIAPAPPAPRATPPEPPAPAAMPPRKVQLGDEVVPRAYDLHLTVDPSKPRFGGEVRIEVDVRVATDTIVLHGRDLAITEARVEVGSRSIAARTESRPAVGAREAKGELVVRMGEWLAPGPARLVFRWDAPFSALWGLYRTEVGGQSFAFSQMEPIDARRAFPCFDEPRFKTPFSIRVTAPSELWARSNGEETRVEAGRDGTTTWTFATTPPIPTYLTAFAVGELERKTLGSAGVGLVAMEGRAAQGTEALEAGQKILADQATWFGVPYAYGKLDLVAVPDFGPGAMENPGLVTFRDEFLLLGEDPPASLRRSMRGIVAHELAHQWFGDLVTMRWWDDLWLNEAFATWMAPKTVDAVFPGANAVDDRVLWEARAVDGDVLPSARPVRPTITSEDAIHESGGWSAYLKGSTVLAMIERWMGPEKFQEGIRAYIREFAHGNATAADLTRALEKAAPGTPVGKVLSSFVDQPGVPLVRAKLLCDDPATPKKQGGTSIQLEVSALRIADPAFQGRPEPRWSVPVCVRSDVAAAPACVVVESGAPATLPLSKCPAWFHPDAGEVGYYRWDLEGAAWDKLLGAAATLTPAERAGLVLDTWSLAQTGRATTERVIDAIRALQLRADEPRVVVEAVVIVLRDLDRVVVDDASRKAFQIFVQATLGRVTVPSPKPPRTTRGDEQRLLRITLLSALHDLARDPRIDASIQRARRGAPDPDLITLALRADARSGARTAEPLATEAGFLAATRDRPPAERVAALSAMGSFTDPARLRAALGVTLLPSFRAGDFRHVRQAALRTRETRLTYLRWMTDRFEPLAKKLGGAGSLVGSLGVVCDVAELERMEAFFGPRIATLEGAQRGWDEGRADARRCIALRKQLAPSLAPALEKR